MYRKHVIAVALLAALLGGCQTRSISNSGYQEDGYYGYRGNELYQGEISDLDLFVPEERAQPFTGDIAAALSHAEPVAAQIGQPLLVVQSGAFVPDEAMTDALRTHFEVAPFSGVPVRPRYPEVETASTIKPGSYGERLRLAAAQGGYRHILVYWGQIESLVSNGPTKAISWVPIIGMVVPDESQRMRIRLKGALIDVASGRWRMVLPDSVEGNAISASINRATSDQEQVETLKAAGYGKLADLVIAAARPGTATN